MRDTEAGHRDRQRERKKQAPCRELDVGLNPRTPGSRPEAKADTQPLSHPDVPLILLLYFFLKILFIYSQETQSMRERGRDIGRGKSRPMQEA